MIASKDHVVSGLIEKRRELAGIIDELQRRLDQHRADLTHMARVRSPISVDPLRHACLGTRCAGGGTTREASNATILIYRD
jgi:hypothetical protein